MRTWLLLLAFTILSLAPGDVVAQTKRATVITTKSGVYSKDQAVRGKDVYAGYCKSCHTVETHTGTKFNENWNGKRLSELFAYMRERMPKNEPGSLSDQEYADVLSYVLRMNQMPAGAHELPVDSMAMRRIRIETTKISVRKEK